VGQHKCSNCGFAPEKQNDIHEEDGELVKYGEGSRWTIKQKTEWMQMFASYVKAQGKKPGWAIFLYRSKFNEEPPVKWPKKSVTPSAEVVSWIKHQQIRYAKGKAKQEATHAA
jgi:hypothetical protein